jgi:predicted DNA-binding helix-hairpin-helix protein
LTVSVAKLRPFIITSDWRPVLLSDKADLRGMFATKPEQFELFAT